jgi:hypothetical protein
MIRPNKVDQTQYLGTEGIQPESGNKNRGLQSYDGPHGNARYKSSQQHHDFTTHVDKDHPYTNRGYARHYALATVGSDYYNSSDIAILPATLDLITVKQLQEPDKKLDGITNIYVGSLTVLGLYVLYRYLHK